jgi:hypothetical protein
MRPEGLEGISKVIAPGADDWLVTLRLRSGAIVTRRVTPGRVSEEFAVRAAMRAQSARPADVLDVEIRRAGEEKRIVVETDGFQELLKRARRA